MEVKVGILYSLRLFLVMSSYRLRLLLISINLSRDSDSIMSFYYSFHLAFRFVVENAGVVVDSAWVNPNTGVCSQA